MHRIKREASQIKNCIYLAKIDPSLSQERLDDLLQLISKENREKCYRFKFKEDALRTLYGELMVRHFLCQKFSFKNEEIELLKSDEGKPYIEGHPIHFNISHAGDFVVCAFSEQAVGIDIEQIKEIELEIGRRFFCPSEYADLLAQKTTDQLDYFFTLWTLKESYMKWLGTGMSIPLDSFCFKITNAGISCLDDYRAVTSFFKQFPIEGYKLSICSMIDDFPDQIKELRIEELISFADHRKGELER